MALPSGLALSAQGLRQAATIPDILTELGMLAGLAAACLVLAVWRPRRTITA